MILINKYLIPDGYNSVAIYPFIILKDEVLRYNQTLINHNKIHLAQQKELWVVGYFILYFLNWIFNIVFEPCSTSEHIIFEQEANEYQNYLPYLENRRKFNWTQYV
jgi:hypothetical protein